MIKRKKIILSIILCCFMALGVMLGVFWLKKPDVSFAVEAVHDHGDYTAWGNIEEEKGSLPKVAGSYYLTNDIYLSNTWTAPSGTVNICLNGKSVLMKEECDVISVPSGATLNIYECDKTEQDVYGIKLIGGYIMATSKYGEETKAIKGITVSGTLNVYGGTLLGAKTGIYVLNGNFNMFGGSITANVHASEKTDVYGAGVLVDGGSFTMNGGEIFGNRLRASGSDTGLYSYGAGVFVDNDGSFTMNGGEIYGNESYYGSGIYVKNGTFTMTDGEIHDNEEEGCFFGAGLFVAENGKASLTGGKIYNNKIRDYKGGAGVYSKGDLSLGGTIQIVNNTHTSDDGGRSNLFIDNTADHDKIINLISPENGMLVGVSMSSLTTFTDIEEMGNEKYFFADNEDEYILYDGHIKLKNRKGTYDRIYKINIEYCEHGVVYANMQAVYENIIEAITVNLTVAPEDCYVLKSLKYNGNDITQEKSFAMPGEDVTVTAEFELEKVYVAQINDNYYISLADAIEKVYDGETIIILNDIGEEEIIISKEITFYIDNSNNFVNEANITAGFIGSDKYAISILGTNPKTVIVSHPVAYNITTGTNYKTLKEALSNAVSGDVIELRFYESDEDIVLPFGVTLYTNEYLEVTVTREDGLLIVGEFVYGKYKRKYVANDSLTVTFASGSKDFNLNFIYTRTAVTSGEKVEKPEDPIFLLSRFIKWVTEIDGDEEFDFNTPITEDITLYAKWERSSRFFLESFIQSFDSLKRFYIKNDIKDYTDFYDALLYNLQPDEYRDLDIDYLNALIFCDLSQIFYSYLNFDLFSETEDEDPYEEIFRCFLRSSVLFEDFAKLADTSQHEESFNMLMTALEIHSDYVAGIKMAFSGKFKDEDYLYKQYFNSLQEAIAKDDITLLLPSSFYEKISALQEEEFSKEWSFDETMHWHEAIKEGVDIVTGFNSHTFDNGVSNGNTTVYTCSVCGCSYTDYGVTYTWNGKRCTAKYSCSYGNKVEEIIETVEGEYVIDTDATCLTVGKGHYKATFENELFEEQNTQKDSVTNGNPLGHDFNNYVSNGDASCLADGTKTSKCSRCEVTNTIADEGSKLEHDFEIIYGWDGNKCTATATCKHDNSHIITETVTATYVKDSDATTEANEKGHYEATFENSIFVKQVTETNSVEIKGTIIVNNDERGGCGSAIGVTGLGIISSVCLIAFGIIMIMRKRKNKKA